MQWATAWAPCAGRGRERGLILPVASRIFRCTNSSSCSGTFSLWPKLRLSTVVVSLRPPAGRFESGFVLPPNAFSKYCGWAAGVLFTWTSSNASDVATYAVPFISGRTNAHGGRRVHGRQRDPLLRAELLHRTRRHQNFEERHRHGLEERRRVRNVRRSGNSAREKEFHLASLAQSETTLLHVATKKNNIAAVRMLVDASAGKQSQERKGTRSVLVEM